MPTGYRGHVRPLAGAGIEIELVYGLVYRGDVRPLAGAGIEIAFPSWFAPCDRSPPRGGGN